MKGAQCGRLWPNSQTLNWDGKAWNRHKTISLRTFVSYGLEQFYYIGPRLEKLIYAYSLLTKKKVAFNIDTRCQLYETLFLHH